MTAPAAQARTVVAADTVFLLRESGSGYRTPVVLLHGVPETSSCWRDVAPALAAGRRVLAPDLPGVRVEHRRVPDDWPSGLFDAVVVSEVGYFLDPASLERTVTAVASCLADDGVVLLCHWRHPVEGWVLDGADVHAAFASGASWTRLAQYVDDVIAEVMRTKPVRSHFTFTQGAQASGGIGLLAAVRAVAYCRLEFDGT